MTGLKPIYGGSTPPFLVSVADQGWTIEILGLQTVVRLVWFEQMQVLQRCGMVEGSREVILHLLWLAQLIELLV